jgi:hypothetical protein
VLNPNVERRLGHRQVARQLLDRPFVGLTLDRRLAARVFGRCDAGLEQKMPHHLSGEGVATFGRPPTFTIENIGDLGGSMACAEQFARAGEKIMISA